MRKRRDFLMLPLLPCWLSSKGTEQRREQELDRAAWLWASSWSVENGLSTMDYRLLPVED